jgi:hypothetical protein
MMDRGGTGGGGEESAILIALSEVRRDLSEGPVTFQRRELDLLLGVYGRMVAAGEWRDYAIDHLRDRAVFSVFRRASEVPVFQIVKNPKLARRQGAYSIVAVNGLVLKRGHELARVLRFFEARPILVKA